LILDVAREETYKPLLGLVISLLGLKIANKLLK
jgi:hypothetical protein